MLSHRIKDLLFHFGQKTCETWILQCNTQFYCVIPCHILRVVLTLYRKMAQEWNNKYILFDGLTYNTRGYFASCVVFFRAPKGRE